MNRRQKGLNSMANPYSIDVSSLNIPTDIRLIEYERMEDSVNAIRSFLLSNSLDEIKYGIYRLRCLTLKIGPKINIINYPLIELLISILETHIEKLDVIYEVLWILINVSCVETDRPLLNDKLFNILSFILTREESHILEVAIWLLSNVVSEDENAKKMVLFSPMFEKLTQIINARFNDVSLMKILCQFYSCLNNKRQSGFTPELNEFFLNVIQSFYFHFDIQVKMQSIWAFSNFISCPESLSIIEKIFNSGILQHIIQSEIYKEVEVKSPTVIIIGSFFSLDTEIFDVLIESGVLKVLKDLIVEKYPLVRNYCCWALANIYASSKPQILKTLSYVDFTHDLIYIIRNEMEKKTKREALNALTNLCINSKDFDTYVNLVSAKALDAYLEIIEPYSEAGFVLAALTGVEAILEGGESIKKVNKINTFAKKFDELGGKAKLEMMQQHQNQGVYNKAWQILSRFFPEDN